MADEIDIEEHDVLDNPAIKKIFPDISRLKEEIQDFESVPDVAFEEASIDICSFNSTNQQESEASSSESTGNSTHISTEPSLAPDLNSSIVLRPIQTNKIIIGTKRPKLENEKALKLVLDDIFVYLKSNERFCNVCLRLFRKRSDLIVHSKLHTEITNADFNELQLTKSKRIKLNHLDKQYIKDKKITNAESSKEQREIYKIIKLNHLNEECIEGTAIEKSIKDTIQLKQNKSNKTLKLTINDCFHCNTKFLTTDALVNHLYDVLQQEQVFEGNKISEKIRLQDEIEMLKKTQEKTILSQQILGNSSKTKKVAVKKKLVDKNICDSDDKLRHLKTNERIKSNLGIKENASKHYSLRNKANKKNQCKFDHEKAYNVTESKTQNKSTTKKTQQNETISKPEEKKEKINFEETRIVYRCPLCFQYFRNVYWYGYHMRKTHNLTKNANPKNEKFNPFCKFCSTKRVTLQAYNTHLLLYHKKQVVLERKNNSKKVKVSKKKKIKRRKPQKRTRIKSDIGSKKLSFFENDEELLSITSILYRCTKCDTNFTSLQEAINHTDHMDLLINWKCPTCHKIFKQNDKDLHIQQHSYFEELYVHEVDENRIAKFLYKCLKCGIHFGESNFLKHYPKCESLTPESGYCNICDILIEKYLKASHEFSHKYENMKPEDFIFIGLKVVVIENIKRKKPKLKGPMSIYTAKEGNEIPESLYTMYHCDTCNLFVPTRHKTHLESHCKHLSLVNFICRYCGLNLTSKSIVGHRRMHMKYRFVKLEHIVFYDLRSLRPIQPPIPTYRKCDCCDVHFEDKNVKDAHLCSEVKYETCHICNIKLSAKAFILHMGFHNYSMKSFQQQTSSNIERFNREVTDITSLKNKESKNKLDIIFSIPETKEKSQNTYNLFTTNDLDSANLENKEIESEKMPLQGQQLKEIQIEMIDLRPVIKNTNSDALHPKFPEFVAQSITVDFEKNIIFKCLSCLLKMNTYDKVVEHCQEHYIKQDTSIEREKCVSCDLLLDKDSYANHEVCHNNKHFDNRALKIIDFEYFYFSHSDEVWIQHVFKSLPDEAARKNIIGNSLYNLHRKIKLEVLQDGPSQFTVYKCHKCNVFHDPATVMKHAQHPCALVHKKFPCKSCGLPFNNLQHRSRHEQLHKNNKIISLKSYRIVVFNKEKDKKENEKLASLTPMHYVLFQCRSCSSIVDKSKIKTHVCDRSIEIQCLACHLYIEHDIYDEHCKNHEQFPSFCQQNMKVILFGKTPEKSTKIVDFTGTVCDYTLFKCMKCRVCVDQKKEHTCLFGPLSKSLCSVCEKYILKIDLKKHKEMHQQIPEFIKDYIRVEEFNEERPTVSEDDCVSPNDIVAAEVAKEDVTKVPSRLKEDIQVITSKAVDQDKSDDTASEIAKIYKCNCGLHFLDELSFEKHCKICSPKIRISKQTCPKCNLLFTPNTLFNHLIMHHGNKTHEFTFNLIEQTTAEVDN